MRTETVESLYAQLVPNVKGYIKAFRIKCKDTIDELHQEARLVIWRVLTNYPEYTGSRLLKTCSLAIINRYKDLHRMKIRYEIRTQRPGKLVCKTTPYDINSSQDILATLLVRINAAQDKREEGSPTKSPIRDSDIVQKLLENGGHPVMAARDLGVSKESVEYRLRAIRAHAAELLAR